MGISWSKYTQTWVLSRPNSAKYSNRTEFG